MVATSPHVKITQLRNQIVPEVKVAEVLTPPQDVTGVALHLVVGHLEGSQSVTEGRVKDLHGQNGYVVVG